MNIFLFIKLLYFWANYNRYALWSPCVFRHNSVVFRNASRPNKPVQKTLDKLFVKGSAQLLAQAGRLGGERPYTYVTHIFRKVKVTKEECNIVAVGVHVLFCSHAVRRSLRLFK